MNIDQTIQLGLQHHQAGRFGQAEPLYRAALQHRPNDAQLLHLVGVLYGSTGRRAEAIAVLERAINLQPRAADFHNSLGEQYRITGRIDDAIAAQQRAVQLNPNSAAALNNLGLAQREKGQIALAIDTFRRATQIHPPLMDPLFNLGLTLQDVGKTEEAIRVLQQAAQVAPGHWKPWSMLAAVFRSSHQLAPAIAAARKVVAIRPDSADTYQYLIGLLLDDGQADEPAELAANALTRFPDNADLHRQFSVALGRQGKLAESIHELEAVIRAKPDHADARLDLANALLLQANFDRGWTEYEWRWRSARFPERLLGQPRWNGEPLNGRSLLIHAEQGFGDVIQFARYLPRLAEMGGRIYLVCDGVLIRLLRQLPNIQIVNDLELWPETDLQCPMMSLALIFQTRLESIPPKSPYLTADPQRVDYWADKTRSISGLKVGLVWAGQPTHFNDRNRSLRLEQLAPLAAVSEVSFFSLQIGPAAGQAAAPPTGMRLIDFTGELSDFAETAALVMNLDLVISVDTAIVHLAGALGKPAWVMLPYVPDWRWMLDREDSPWYPTMRLFRQPGIGQWEPVIGRMADELKKQVSKA